MDVSGRRSKLDLGSRKRLDNSHGSATERANPEGESAGVVGNRLRARREKPVRQLLLSAVNDKNSVVSDEAFVNLAILDFYKKESAGYCTAILPDLRVLERYPPAEKRWTSGASNHLADSNPEVPAAANGGIFISFRLLRDFAATRCAGSTSRCLVYTSPAMTGADSAPRRRAGTEDP